MVQCNAWARDSLLLYNGQSPPKPILPHNPYPTAYPEGYGLQGSLLYYKVCVYLGQDLMLVLGKPPNYERLR